mgnify:CR=1 FL=1
MCLFAVLVAGILSLLPCPVDFLLIVPPAYPASYGRVAFGLHTDPDLPEKHMAVSFRYRLLDEFLKEWQLRKKQLREGEITKEEYLEWKLNWPQTADGCGRYEPKKKWRKE